jgi:3,4-dihydroxy-2-butanone 4-phosphate synthase
VTSVDQNQDADSPFDSVEDAIAAIGRGEIVVVVDDEDRENEGDLIMAAEFATEEKIAFFVNHTSGVICAPVTEERADELDLRLMVAENTEVMRTAFTVTVDLRAGTSTGISAHDRALTLRAMVDPQTTGADLARPGHIFPLRAREGGVLKRAGHTEAAVDLARMAGLKPGGVLCEIVKPDGTMARVPDLVEFCKEHGLVFISIADMVRYRRRHEKLVVRVSEARIPTDHGEFKAVVYESVLEPEQHIAFVMGDPDGKSDVLVRVHSECLTGDIFGSRRCDCGPQLDKALQQIAEIGGATKDAVSDWATRSGLTASKTRVSTPSMPISSLACPPIVVSTGSALRCWWISESPACDCSPTIRPSMAASTVSASRSPSECRWKPSRRPRIWNICAPSGNAWVTSSEISAKKPAAARGRPSGGAVPGTPRR